jgi:pentose-5-phosphate-3-epimerase
LHVDIMRPSFIKDKSTFLEEQIDFLYSSFEDKCIFDFHLMVSNPSQIIDYISNLVEVGKRDKVYITIHAESFRNYEKIGFFADKKCDLSDYKISNFYFNELLRQEFVNSNIRITEKIREMKSNGFSVGIALEPRTYFKNINELMAEDLDMILLMGVESGAGGQEYMRDIVTPKIKHAKIHFSDKIIQVDGGVNDKTINGIINAGANNLVIGSYITNQKYIKSRIDEIYTQIYDNLEN